VFGGTLVCKDADTARILVSHPDVRTRCVTLAGDVYDPSGTLTGGAPPSVRPVLNDLHELNQARAALAAEEAKLAALDAEAEKLRAAAARCEDLSRRHELAAHRCDLLRARVEASAASQLARQVKELEEVLAAREADVVKAKERNAAALARVEELQAKAKALKAGGREGEIKRLEEEIGGAKAALAAAVKALAAATQFADRHALELEALEKERDGIAEQVTAAEASLERARTAEAAAQEALEKATSMNEMAKGELDKKRSSIQSQSEAIKQMLKQRDDLYRKQSEADVAQKKAEAKAHRLSKDRAEAEKFVAQMLAKHAWIAADRQQFGKRGGEYDWSEGDGAVERARARLATLQADHERLSKVINRKAVAMFDTAERDFRELVRKKQIVEHDRQKIADVIKELDTKKGEALRATWHKVNTDFGSIFTSLLPGASARLEPPSGGTGDVVVDGLEVHVGLGGVWKDGLTELSGGQRSLLALSLILALLRFKPAPVYILDEVDAALDPSHTQNIGKMLAAHFRASQFIVVSLKKGMWANANVLFKCRCIDGVSTVTRVTAKDVPDREADLVLRQQHDSSSGAAPSATTDALTTAK
jgi:structural maintenance of chromosome 2